MRTIASVTFLSLGFAGSLAWSDEVANNPTTYEWSKSRSVTADFNRDGSPDQAELGVGKDRVGLRIRLDGKLLPVLEIPIDGSKQFGICPDALSTIRIEPQSEVPLNALGETPKGYEICPRCVEIVVNGGECDPLHFYWDTTTNAVAWWRE